MLTMKVKAICLATLFLSVSRPVLALEPGNSGISGVKCPWIVGTGLDVNKLLLSAPTVVTSPYASYYVVTRSISYEVFQGSNEFIEPLGNEVTFFGVGVNGGSNVFYVQYPGESFNSISDTFTGSFASNGQGGLSATLQLSCGDTMTIVTTRGGS